MLTRILNKAGKLDLKLRFIYLNYVGYRKVSTVCAYLSRILVTVTLRMCSDFLYQLESHRRHFVKFALCLCLFVCVKHV